MGGLISMAPDIVLCDCKVCPLRKHCLRGIDTPKKDGQLIKKLMPRVDKKGYIRCDYQIKVAYNSKCIFKPSDQERVLSGE